MAIDFSSPLAKGNYIVFKGESSTGKSFVAGNLIKNFLNDEEKAVYNTKMIKTKAVYVTLNLSNAKKMKKILENSHNYVIFSTGPNPSLLEKFLLPFSAIKAAKEMQKQNQDILLVFDDVLEHFYRETQLFTAMNQPFVKLYS